MGRRAAAATTALLIFAPLAPAAPPRDADTLARLREGILDGSIDPRTVFYDADALGLAPLEPAAPPHRAARTHSARTRPAASRGLPGAQLDYFEGFETYEVDPDPSNNDFPLAVRLNGQIQPSGLPAIASSMFVVVATPLPAYTDGQGFQYSPAVPNSTPPAVNAPWNADRDANVGQALMDGRGSRFAGGGGTLSSTFVGFRVLWGRAFGGVPPSIGQAYRPTAQRDLLVTIDFYLGDYETDVLWSPSSSLEGYLISRYYCSGVAPGDPLADPDGRLRRPLMLSSPPGLPGFGQFYRTPTLGSAGQPPTFETKVNEWFTAVLRLNYANEFGWWVRDSGTDGSGSILIDDARNVAFLEVGWAELFPGQSPGAAVPMGGVTMWRGYGRAIDEFGAQGPAVALAPAGLSTDNGFTLITRGPIDTIPTWKPTNHFVDNIGVIGTPIAPPVQPEFVVPYIDDMERYYPLERIAVQGGRWTASASSDARVSTDFNATPPPDSTGSNAPNQSILHRSIHEDSFMRMEVATDLPPGSPLDAAFDPRIRAWASPGAPARASIKHRLNNFAAVSALRAVDDDATAGDSMLLLGATNRPSDLVNTRRYVRLPNPLFSPLAPTSNDARVDDLPTLAHNSPLINWPTTSALTLDAFVTHELVLFADGTAAWEVGGAALVFDPDFYTQDSRLQDELRKAKRLQLGLPASTPLSDPALAPPYTRFLSTLRTIDRLELWSGNNLNSFNNRVYLDDVRVSGPARTPGPGPAFTLPYSDAFAQYTLDEPIAGQGALDERTLHPRTPMMQADPRARWIDAASFGSPVASCLYTVSEAFSAAGAWGVGVGSTIQVRKPFGAYVCPTFDSITAGVANFTLIDPAPVAPRPPLVVRVGFPGQVTTDGSSATLRAEDDRHHLSTWFCRYLVENIELQPNPLGGIPFTLPPGVSVGATLAIDAPFPVNTLTGLRPCPEPPYSSAWLFTRTRTPMALLALTPAPEGFVPDPCAPAGDVFAATQNPPQTDARALQFLAVPGSRWTDLSASTAPSGGRAGDGFVRVAQSEVDAVRAASIDPAADFGAALAFLNTNLHAPRPQSHSSAEVRLPLAVSEESPSSETSAGVFWDMYVQDTNTRWTFVVTGDELDCDGGHRVVAAFRFGVPGDQTALARTIHVATSDQLTTFTPTSAQFPIGAWFRVGFEIDAEGVWRLGINTLGAPSGPPGPDEPRHFAFPGAGAPHPSGVFVAEGASLSFTNIGERLRSISALAVLQGFDNEGDGAVELARVTVEALDQNAPRPAGLGAFDFCFYQVTQLEGSPSGPLLRTVNSSTGAVTGSRAIGTTGSDIVAVRFNTLPAEGPVVTSFGACPRNATFAFAPTGPNPGDAPLGTRGTWTLTDMPDIETTMLPPVNGIANAAGPSSGSAYNSPGLPARNILLARFIDVPPHPAPEIASRMWIDNLSVQERKTELVACLADLTGDGLVNAADLAFMLGAWGACAQCPADIDASGVVNSADLAVMLGAWGPCP